jgi:hypothetical protein
MVRIIAILLFTILTSPTSIAQSKYGKNEKDSVLCVRRLSMHNQYYVMRRYKDALPYWEEVVKSCPYSYDPLFYQGRIMILDLIEKESNKSQRKTLIKKLRWMYDQWIMRDGQLPEIIDQRKIDLDKHKN